MTTVVDHLAELTGYRDRDVMDATLVASLADILLPLEVAIYRVLEEGGRRHWVTRAVLARGDATVRADPLWVETTRLPTLESRPDRLACLERADILQRAGPPAVMHFPLRTETHTVGVLEITSARPLAAVDCRTVSGILRIYRNFHGLLDYGERDTLTGLLNRKTFDANFRRLVQPDTPLPTPLPIGTDDAREPVVPARSWLAVIDIDHFKRVNDDFGHLIGDEVLLLLSRLMRSSLRCHDHLYRFGGEEFVVMMRCADGDAALAALERLRGSVAGYGFPQVDHIAVSIGCTELDAIDTASEAFDRADKALYHAKQNGRNQVACHAALVAAGVLTGIAACSDIELF